MTSAFAPTHRITLDNGVRVVETIDVCLCADENGDGPAYTRAEWESETSADWERDEQGRWTFQGRATPGPGLDVTVEALANDA
jgi:hypothetical protein